MFNNIASVSTGNVPNFLFNLTGITAWNYFNQCFTSTSNTFNQNAALFGKVYFPRVIVPLSKVIAGLVKFGIQILILIVFYCYFIYQASSVAPNSNLILFPFYVILMALMGLGFGMIISAMTTKYRDLTVLIGFATSLLVYISAVPYPLSQVEAKMPDIAWIVRLNPLTQIIEGFRYMILDEGIFNLGSFLYTVGISIMLFIIGLIIFNKTEKNFIDTV